MVHLVTRARFIELGNINYFIPPYAISGTHSLTTPILNNHKSNLEYLFDELKSDKIDFTSAQKHELLNDYIETLKG